MKRIKLGDKVKCKYSGFVGIAVAKTEFINGCVQYLVLPEVKKKDNAYPEEASIDIDSLELISKPKKKVAKSYAGGPSKIIKAKRY